MIYTATFAAQAVSAASDLWEILAPASTPVALREIRIGQYTDFGDAAAELISIQIIRGYTTTGSGGAAVTPVCLKPWNTNAAGSTVKRNNTTVAQDGTGAVLLADTFNVASGWWYRPPAQEFIMLSAATRLVVRITAPVDSITMNSTLVFEENPGR